MAMRAFKPFTDPQRQTQVENKYSITNICVYKLKKKKKIQKLSNGPVAHTPGRVLRTRTGRDCHY